MHTVHYTVHDHGMGQWVHPMFLLLLLLLLSRGLLMTLGIPHAACFIAMIARMLVYMHVQASTVCWLQQWAGLTRTQLLNGTLSAM